MVMAMAAEHYSEYPRGREHQQQTNHFVVKAATAVMAGGALFVLSGLTLAATVIGLTMATPLLVIFSPVLVPAAVTTFLVTAGFLASGVFGVAAITVLSWMYRYVTGKHPPGADHLDMARENLAWKAREMKEKPAQHYPGAGAGAGAQSGY